jgi:hypothetical protein
MDQTEKKIRQEDCYEDTFGSGILTLTTKRVAFDKTKGRIADFSKKIGETVIDVHLNRVLEVWKEGLFMKKVCLKAEMEKEQKVFKFGVFNNGSWLETLQETIEEYKDQ